MRPKWAETLYIYNVKDMSFEICRKRNKALEKTKLDRDTHFALLRDSISVVSFVP
jgi:hypothetical protein